MGFEPTNDGQLAPEVRSAQVPRRSWTRAAALKRIMLTSRVGRGALKLRDLLELVTSTKESLGTKANDQLANRYVARLCRPHRTYVDVGAHIGSTLAEALDACPQVRIIAFEAIPDKAREVQSMFKDALVLNYAVGETTGPVSFFIDGAHSACSSLAPSGSDVQEIIIPGATLDQLIDREDVDLIKVDVEGAELGVMRGAEQLIARCRPTIMFESGPTEVLGYTKEAMHRWFTDRQYGIYLPSRLPHAGPPMSLELYLDSHVFPFRTLNYFAVPLEKAEEVRHLVSDTRS